ncbi:hypothetical protein PIB30_100669 [Stylosanthes scabra]|uniref:Carboxypeptidase n=1 Tax=Stylosanthes scabra TaxID=79078 RepID=A0ABU6ZVU0_9FABA|nr:hypothetical protein [Stylosanthes scabra]
MESTSNTLTISLCFCFCFIIIQANVVLASSNNSNNPFPKEAHPTKSGYLPVSTTSSSAIFYAFYEAQNSTISLSQTPLLIWLQGGLGTSSMIGNLYEVGPWLITQSLTLQPNSASWNRIFGLLFLDNPIGTGFSVASSPNEIPTDQKGVAKHLFASITRFLQLDPVFKHRPIYLIGNSYGGKYVTSLGYYILKENARRLSGSQRVNLVGVVIGDGATEPVTQVATSADSGYYVGLINEKQKRELEKLQWEAVRLERIGNWKEATDAVQIVWSKFQDMAGLHSLFDYTMRKDSYPFYDDWINQFMNKAEVKKALGVNESQVFNVHNDVVHAALSEDLAKSVKHMVEHLLRSGIQVLLYQGQYDLVGGPVQVEAWVKTLKWEGIEEYLNAERKIWKVNGELAGYVQQWKSLTNVVVLGGGHLLPADQPLNAQTMIQDWVLQRGIFGNSPSFSYISMWN